MKVRVYITLRKGILDPQGKAVEQSLKTLGFKAVEEVRVGKYLEIDVKESSPEMASRDVEAMCKKLLANTVIEDYRLEVDRGAPATSGTGGRDENG